MRNKKPKNQMTLEEKVVEMEKEYLSSGGPSCKSFLITKVEENSIDKILDFREKISKVPESNQIPEGITSYVNDDIIAPLYNLDELVMLPEINTRLNRMIRTKARNVGGLGYKVIPEIPITQLESEEEKQITREEIKKVTNFLKNCNNDMSFTRLNYCVKMDEQTLGQGYYEIIRDEKTKEIVAIHHLPAYTMRIRKNDKGYMQYRYGFKRFFKKFGDPDEYDSLTGINLSEVARLNEEKKTQKEINGKFNKLESELLKENPWPKNNYLEAKYRYATEVIMIKVYSSLSTTYGIPVYTPAIPAIIGNRSNAIRNLSFFDNDATPRMIITITGSKFDAETEQNIERFLHIEGKGVKNAHRALLLQLKGSKDFTPTVELHPMTVGKTEDQSFGNYKKDNDEETREAFGLAKLYLGTSDDVNRSSAYISRQICNQQEFDPEIIEMEEILTKKIINQGLNCYHVKLHLERPKASDNLEEAKIQALKSSTGSITPNELRQERGDAPFPEEQYYWSNVPFVWARDLLKNGEISPNFKSKKTPKSKTDVIPNNTDSETIIEEMLEEKFSELNLFNDNEESDDI